MQKQIGAKRIRNDFGIFVPETSLQVVSNDFDLISERKLSKLTMEFTANNVVSS